MANLLIKLCNKCEMDKPIEEFYKHSKHKDGRTYSCKVCTKVRTKAWRELNPEKHKAQVSEYAKSNPRRITEAKRKWNTQNRGIKNAATAHYRAKKLDQTPELTLKQVDKIRRIYKRAQLMTRLFGESYHVDHFWPISKGGLHHPDNLFVLRGTDNISKGNRT